MLVYLVRHAIATPRGDDTADEERPLTDKGIARMEEIVEGLGGLGVALDEIWTSPLVRARQTADILAGLDGFSGPLRTVGALAPGGDEADVIQLLIRSNVESVALVGHEPDLGDLCARLLTSRGDGFICLKKGAVACVELSNDAPDLTGVLLWLMQPRQLRSVRS